MLIRNLIGAGVIAGTMIAGTSATAAAIRRTAPPQTLPA